MAPRATVAPSRARTAEPSPTTSVLVVDDEGLASEIATWLADRGLAATTCASTDELDGRAGAAAVIVVAAAPDAAGTHERVRRLRRKAPSARFVVVERIGDERVEAAEVGAIAVVRRPLASSALDAAVGRAMDGADGFAGRLHGLSLIDLLQAYSQAGASLSLTIQGELEGRIVLRDGDIVDAECDGMRGAPALVPVLRMRRGVVDTRPLGPHTRTVHLPFDHVLLETLRVLDEGRRRSAPPPARHASGEFSFAGLLEEDPLRSSLPPPVPTPIVERAWPDPLAPFLAAHAPGAAAWWCHADGRVRSLVTAAVDGLSPTSSIVALAAAADPHWRRVELRRGSTAWAAIRHRDGVVVLGRRDVGDELLRRFRYEVSRLVRWLAEEATDG